MAVAKKIQLVIDVESVFGVTPKGTAYWCKWSEPDNYGNYSVDMYFDDDTTDKIIEKLEVLRNEGLAQVQEAKKQISIIAEVYKEKEGKRYFQFKVSQEKQDKPITIFDVYGRQDKEFDALIGNGSVLKVKYMAKPYYMNSTKAVGVSLRLMAIQIIDLVEFTNGSSDFMDESDSIDEKPKYPKAPKKQESFGDESEDGTDEDF